MNSRLQLFSRLFGALALWLAMPATVMALDIPHDATNLPGVCATCHVPHVAEPTSCDGPCPAGQHPRQTDGVCVPDDSCPGACDANEICTLVNGVANCQCPPNFTGPTCSTCAPGYSGAGCTTADMTCSVVGGACAGGNGTCGQTGCGGECPAGQHNRITDGACVADETCPGTGGTSCGAAGTCTVEAGIRNCSCGLNFTQDGTCKTCAPGYAGYPTCSLVACISAGDPCAGGHGTCALISADCNVDSCAGHHSQSSDVCEADQGNVCGPNALYTDKDGVASCQCPPNWRDDGVGGFCNVCATGYSGPTCTTLDVSSCTTTGDPCAGGAGTCTVAGGSETSQVAQSDTAFIGTLWSDNGSKDVSSSNGLSAKIAVANSTMTVNFDLDPSAGALNYQIWVAWSAFKTANGGGATDMTIDVLIDGVQLATSLTGNAANTWAWSNLGSTTLSGGPHTIAFVCTVGNLRGCGIDGFVITTDSALGPNYAAGPFAVADDWDLDANDYYTPGGGSATCSCAASAAYAADCLGCRAGYHLEGGQCVADGTGVCAGQTCSSHGTCFVKTSSKGTPATGLCDCVGEYYDNPSDGANPLSCDTCTKTGGLQCTPSSGYTGANLELCAVGYHQEGGSCVLGADQCSGATCDGRGTCGLTANPNTTSYPIGSGLCDCSEHYYGTSNTQCDVCGAPSLSCGCKTGYTGANCATCDTVGGYVLEGGTCVKPSVCNLQYCSSHGTCYPTSGYVGLDSTAACACTEHFYGASPAACNLCASAQPAPYLTSNPNGINSLCLGCHSAAGPGPEVDTHMSSVAGGGDFDFTKLCTDCHDPHTQPTAADIPWTNSRGTRSFLRKNIKTSTSPLVTAAITLEASSGPNSWADGTAPYNGICEVCHTQTGHHRRDTSGGDHTHEAGNDCTSCHKHNDTTANAFGFSPSGGDCVGCHASPQPSNVATARRPVVSDFSAAGSHHIKFTTDGGTRNSASAPLSKYDCVICHLEGDSGGATTTLHKNSTVNLRDVDSAANTAWTFQDTDIVDIRPNGLVGAAQLGNMTKFCLRCHDANGIGDTVFLNALKAADTTIGASRTATSPFADGKLVMNVNGQFNPTYYSTHSISSYWNGTAWASGFNAPFPNKGGTTPAIRNAAFANSWTETYTTECSDCHQVANSTATQKFTANAHGSVNTTYLLNSANGLDESIVATNSGASSNVVCLMCHAPSSYVSGVANTKYPDHDQTTNHLDSSRNWLGSSTGGKTGIGCFNCHAGEAAGSIHGENKNLLTTPAPAYVFLSGASMAIWTGNGETSCGALNTTNAMNLGCTQHSGGNQSYTRTY